MLNDREEAYALLRALGAKDRLLRHLALVGEAADGLDAAYRRLGLDFDARLIELGVAVHDAGKILHPDELDGPGSRHEAAGEVLLLKHGVQADVAGCCVSHAAWDAAGLSLEARTVALADKLWKGRREPELELLVIDGAAERLGVDRWEVFGELDSAFEAVAAEGDERLGRSR